MHPDSPRTALVTGAFGFLGSAIAAEFARAGYQVQGVGREAPDDALVAKLGLADYEQLDLPSPRPAEWLARARPDLVVHAAGPASVGFSLDDPRADFCGTVDVLSALLEQVREHSASTAVLILSSAAVYGNPQLLPVPESATLAPVSPYGFHKEMSEALLAEYSSVFGIRTAALRVFSAYGAGLRRQIIWDVCQKARAGEVRLFGTGSETRDFVHASDVARAARLVFEAGDLDGEAYNVASGVETQIRELAEQVISHVNPSASLTFTGEERPGDPLRWRADITRIQELGFRPQVSLAQGVEEYCGWFRREPRR